MAKSSNSGLAAALVVVAGAAILWKYWPASQVIQLQPGQTLHTPDFGAAASMTNPPAPDAPELKSLFDEFDRPTNGSSNGHARKIAIGPLYEN